MEKVTAHRIELTVVLLLIIALPLLFFRSSVTGFVSSDTKAQILNMTFGESQSVNLISADGAAYINFFSISGEVIGDGSIAIYLVNKDNDAHSLVYTNVGQKKKAPLITGMAAAYAEENDMQSGNLILEQGQKLDWPGSLGENSASGSFAAVCMESCYLSQDMFTSDNFELQVYVEPGTILKLQEIFYTVG
jgi:hypothetical protein